MSTTIDQEFAQLVGTNDFAEWEALFEENIPCQSTIDHNCSVTITHRFVTKCGHTTMICKVRLDMFYEQLYSTQHRYTCIDCEEWIGNCWRVIPV